MESSRHNSFADGEGSIEGANDLGGGYDPATSFSGDNKPGETAAESAIKAKQSGE